MLQIAGVYIADSFRHVPPPPPQVVDSDENWSRALYHLRQTLWPAGKLMEKSGRSLGAQEKELLKQKAVEAFIQFLPSED